MTATQARDFMRRCNAEFVKAVTPATNQENLALQIAPMTAALSHATEVARQRTTDARQCFHLVTLDYAARLIREALPDAAAITVDTSDGELHEVRDNSGKALYRAPFTPASPLCDSLADDIEGLFRQLLPFGGLEETGWETAAEGEPYRSILLPPGAQPGTAAAEFPASRAHGSIHAEYTPGVTPAFELDGLDDACIRETRDRIRAAIANSNLEWQPGRMKVVAHWTVASGYSADLAIACTALAAAGAIDPAALNGVALIGELGLDGRVRSVHDVTSAVRMAQDAGCRKCIVATDDFDEASKNIDVTVVGVQTLDSVLAFLEEMHEKPTTTTTAPDTPRHGTPGEDAGQCAQCDRLLVWDASGRGVNDRMGEKLCSRPNGTGYFVHVLAD
ncbi:magnesium chelatase domain-containing protein [Streptomyces sp. TE5632]